MKEVLYGYPKSEKNISTEIRIRFVSEASTIGKGEEWANNNNLSDVQAGVDDDYDLEW
ncbi:MAG: hypothetical protein J6D27_00320 [Ruminiclostridium sp.]|nr:hypothetical protein [Ruminiclostridium sp.]